MGNKNHLSFLVYPSALLCSRSVHDLARLSLTDPVYVSVHENAEHATPDSLSQSYIVVELHQKVGIVLTFYPFSNWLFLAILPFFETLQLTFYRWIFSGRF